jgi:hypothetical protein
MLKIEKNEGSEYDGNLQLLCAGGMFPVQCFIAHYRSMRLILLEFGLRNLIYSVVKLPPQSPVNLAVTISEGMSPTNLARTIVGVLLLCNKNSLDPERVAEAVIHYWYSAKLPKHVWTLINERVTKPVIDLVHKAQHGVDQEENSEGAARIKEQVFDGLSFPLESHLQSEDWYQVLNRLEMNEVDPGHAMLARVVDIQHYGESWQKAAARMTPSRAMGLHRWRADGILLPYSHPREEHDLPNP